MNCFKKESLLETAKKSHNLHIFTAICTQIFAVIAIQSSRGSVHVHGGVHGDDDDVHGVHRGSVLRRDAEACIHRILRHILRVRVRIHHIRRVGDRRLWLRAPTPSLLPPPKVRLESKLHIQFLIL